MNPDYICEHGNIVFESDDCPLCSQEWRNPSPIRRPRRVKELYERESLSAFLKRLISKTHKELTKPDIAKLATIYEIIKSIEGVAGLLNRGGLNDK